jgi:hypothetical protein
MAIQSVSPASQLAESIRPVTAITAKLAKTRRFVSTVKYPRITHSVASAPPVMR